MIPIWHCHNSIRSISKISNYLSVLMFIFNFVKYVLSIIIFNCPPERIYLRFVSNGFAKSKNKKSDQDEIDWTAVTLRMEYLYSIIWSLQSNEIKSNLLWCVQLFSMNFAINEFLFYIIIIVFHVSPLPSRSSTKKITIYLDLWLIFSLYY